MESGWFGQVTLGSTSKLRNKWEVFITIKQAGCVSKAKDFLTDKNTSIITHLMIQIKEY